jgi:hypothetical protein
MTTSPKKFSTSLEIKDILPKCNELNSLVTAINAHTFEADVDTDCLTWSGSFEEIELLGFELAFDANGEVETDYFEGGTDEYGNTETVVDTMINCTTVCCLEIYKDGVETTIPTPYYKVLESAIQNAKWIIA